MSHARAPKCNQMKDNEAMTTGGPGFIRTSIFDVPPTARETVNSATPLYPLLHSNTNYADFYSDIPEDTLVEALSPTPGRYLTFIITRFILHALSSPVNVCWTIARLQYVPNFATRQKVLSESSNTSNAANAEPYLQRQSFDNLSSEAEDIDIEIDENDSLVFDPADPIAQAEASLLHVSRKSAPFDQLQASHLITPSIDHDGYVVYSIADDATTRPQWMLPAPGIHDTDLQADPLSILQAIYAHPEEGFAGLFKGLGTGFVRHLIAEALIPTITATVCDLLGIDDTLLPVDQDNPIPAVLVDVSVAVFVDWLLSPLDIAATRLVAQPSSRSRKYRGFFHAIRAQFDGSRGACNPWLSAPLVSATLTLSTISHLIQAAIPIVIDRGFGISEIYDPIPYATCELAAQCVQDLITAPCAIAQTRIYVQSNLQANDGVEYNAIVPLPPVPYTGMMDAIIGIFKQEGGSRAELQQVSKANTHSRSRHGSNESAGSKRKSRDFKVMAPKISPWNRLDSLYVGLAGQWLAHSAMFLVQVLGAYADLDIEDAEF